MLFKELFAEWEKTCFRKAVVFQEYKLGEFRETESNPTYDAALEALILSMEHILQIDLALIAHAHITNKFAIQFV
jgi:hypothetical protein